MRACVGPMRRFVVLVCTEMDELSDSVDSVEEGLSLGVAQGRV